MRRIASASIEDQEAWMEALSLLKGVEKRAKSITRLINSSKKCPEPKEFDGLVEEMKTLINKLEP